MILKRGKKGTYYVKFMWKGKAVFRSARTTNPKIARQVEAATRNALAKGDVGIFERKPAPTLAEFAEKQFLPWAETAFDAKRKTWLYYRNGVRRLKAYGALASSALDDKRLGEQVSCYIAQRAAFVNLIWPLLIF